MIKIIGLIPVSAATGISDFTRYTSSIKAAKKIVHFVE